MQFKQLGRSGLIVSDLCLGTMVFGDPQRGADAAESEKMIHRFVDAGGNHLDTADVYTNGQSEEVVGRAIKDRRDQVILATKVRFPRGQGKNDVGLSRHHILQGVEASLRRLGTDYIDLYYMHGWDPLTPVEESLRAFDDLVGAGKVRYVGVSNFKAWQLMKAVALSDMHGWARFVAAQYQYSLVKRDIEYEFSDLCLTEGVGITAWGPLGGGFLSGKYSRDQQPQSADEGRIATSPAHVEEAWDRRNTAQNWAIIEAASRIAETRKATIAQIALAWLRAQPAVSSVILGVRTMAQLEDNLGAAEVALSADELGTLNAVSALPELYPYRFLEAQAGRII